MNKYIKSYFKNWWIPIVFFTIPIMIFLLGLVLERDGVITIALVTLFVNIIGTIISSIVQILNGKWYFIISQLIIAGFLFYFTSMIFVLSPPDYYGAHKNIPSGIEISKPIENKPSTSNFKENDLVLTNSYQPGIYRYYTLYQPIEKGFLYLKVYEITSNDRLSEYEMKDRTKIQIDKLEKIIRSNQVIIYEGSWGDEYGSRFELWFQPLNGNIEYKITERNFIIEGWMR